MSGRAAGTSSKGGSLAALDEFMRLYNSTVPANDVSLRIKLATLETVEYLHIADPMVEDPREQNEMEAVRRLVSRRYGLDLDQTDLELLTEIIRNDTDTQVSNTEASDETASVTEQPPVGRSKIVAADDLESVFNDPEFLAAVGEVQTADATGDVSADELLQAAPRLYYSLLQSGGFVGRGAPSGSSALPLANTGGERVPTLDLQDPLGLDPIVFDFLGDDLRTVQPKAPKLKDTSVFEFRSAPYGTRHRQSGLYGAVESAVRGLSRPSLKAAIGAPWPTGAPLRFQTGVSLVAFGASLSVETGGTAPPHGKAAQPVANRAYIVSGETSEQLKAVANDLYPQLLMACLEVVPREPIAQTPLPKRKKKVDVPVAEVASTGKKPRHAPRMAKRQAKRKKLVPNIEYL